LLIQKEIPKEDLDYILEPFKEDKEEDNKQIISEKIIAIVRDANGNIIDKREQKMRSLTEYYLAVISIPILGTYSGSTGTTATGILTNILHLSSQISVSCCSGIAFDMSMYLGSGTQPFSPTTNGLKAPICWGTGSGCLYFLNENFYYNNNSISDIMSVSNKSGNTITVSEIGDELYVFITDKNTLKVYKTFYLNYDTLTYPISIPNGSSATFEILINFSG